jgi:leucine dehydrogenase
MRACVREVFGQDDLRGLTVAIQGLGGVGYALAQEVHNGGGKLIVSDINEEAVKNTVEELGATIATGDEIYSAEADVFAPCALGGVLNPETIALLKCKIVCGGANNQLQSYVDGDTLFERGILYAPDYVVNAGGAIYVRIERTQPDATPEDLIAGAEIIETTMSEIIAESKRTNQPTHVVADRIADERVRKEKERQKSRNNPG